MSWRKIRTQLDRVIGKENIGEEKESGDHDKMLIAGLGNPGREYRDNRHNIGFMAIDRLARVYNIDLGRVQNRAIVGKGRIVGRDVILAKPQTYMNNSGDAVGPLAKYYRIAPANVLIIYDDLDLDLGTLRLRKKGGSGGHNGMKSLIHHLGQDFLRLRLGIGRPPGRIPPSRYVLQDFAADELPILDVLLDHAVEAVETVLKDGIDRAMTRHNGPVIENEI